MEEFSYHLKNHIKDVLMRIQKELYFDEKQESRVFRAIKNSWEYGWPLNFEDLRNEFPEIKNISVVLSRIDEKISSFIENNENIVIKPAIESITLHEDDKRKKGIRFSFAILKERLGETIKEKPDIVRLKVFTGKKEEESPEEKEIKKLLNDAKDLSTTTQEERFGYAHEALKRACQLGSVEREGDSLAIIGLNYWYTGRNQEALDCFMKSLEKYEQIWDLEKYGGALNNIGMAYCHLSEYEKALEFSEKAVKIFKSIGDELHLAATFKNIGIVYENLSKNEDALHFYLEASFLYENVGNREGYARVQSNVGVVYYNLGDYKTSLKYYLKAWDFYQFFETDRTKAILLNNIGSVYERLEDYDKAIEFQRGALREYKKIGDKNGISGVLNNIGNIYKSLKMFDESIKSYQEALDVCIETGYKRHTAKILKNMGTTYIVLRKFDEAKSNIEKALSIAEETGLEELLQLVYLAFSEYYAATADYEKSLEYYKKHDEIKDILYEERDKKLLAEMRAKLESLERKQEKKERGFKSLPNIIEPPFPQEKLA